MKKIMVFIVGFCLVSVVVFAASDRISKKSQSFHRNSVTVKNTKVKLLQSFRVNSSSIRFLTIDKKLYLTAGVKFNKTPDTSTINQGMNFRILYRDSNGFWRDAFNTDGIITRIGNTIKWQSPTPGSEGSYKIHLRGTIRDLNGEELDCNNDGKGEGGSLPAYESAQVNLTW